MLSFLDRFLPEPPQKKPETPDSTGDRKTKYPSAQPHKQVAAHRPRSWLFFAVLLLQILLVLMFRSIPFSAFQRRQRFAPPYTEAADPASRREAATANPTPQKESAFQHSQRFAPPYTAAADPAPREDSSSSADPCPYGRVYVYDLPAEFNTDLVQDCDELSPWSSRCDALSNAGLGPAATGIDAIVPASLAPAWHWTDQFVAEVLFHNRVARHECRTREAASATAFYIPFYAGLAVGKYLWSSYSAGDRDRHGQRMLAWIRDQPHWNRSGGWDHFLALGRISWDFRRSRDGDWGSSLLYMPGMRNVTRLLIERNPWDYFDVGVPYPTGFHPRSAVDVAAWQRHVRGRRRPALFTFAGAPRGGVRNDFRGLLLDHCRSEAGACRAVDCSGSRCANGTAGPAILEAFLGADFCLQPRGDSFTRRSIFDCMVAGSIPVFFWKRTAYYQYQWFLPAHPDSYSVYIDRSEVKAGKSVKAVLESFSREEVRKMREKVIECIPRLVYAGDGDNPVGSGVEDAVNVAIHGVLRRVKEQEHGYKWK